MPTHGDKRGRGRATFCRICEAACALRADVDENGHLAGLRPHREHPISQGFACAKGTRFVEVAQHPERLLHPVRRTADGGYCQASWSQAMELMTSRLGPLIERYGPHAVGIYIGNPLVFNSMASLTMLGFLRALGTRNVFTAASQDCNNKFAGAQIVHGSPLIHPIADFAHTDVALMLGTNPLVSQSSFVHLAGGSLVFDALARRGARMVWVDPRRTESAQRWGEHLPLRPGTDIFLILALLHELRDLYRPNANMEGLERLLELAASYPLQRAAALACIDPGRILDLSKAIRQARHTTFHMSVGVNQGAFGTLCYIALQALAYLSGNLDRPGGLLFHPLAVALAQIGRFLGASNSPPKSRLGPCNTILMSLPGGMMADEILTPGAEQIRALIVVSGDPLTSIPGADRLRQALRQLDLLVCVDLFQNRTGREADLILPATSWLERWDVANTTVLFQQSPLLQYAPALQRPPAEVRSESRILADISLALGRPLWGQRGLAWLWGRLPWDTLLTAFSHALSVPARLRFPAVQGILVPRPRAGRYLGRGPRTPGHRIRFWHADLAGEVQRLETYASSLSVASGTTGSRYRFSLICRRRRLGHNSWLHGAKRDGQAEEVAWLAPQDLIDLGLPQGGKVRLQTSGASLQVCAIPAPDVAPGVVVLPHGLPGANVNALLPSGPEMIEPLSGQHLMTGIPVWVIPE